MDKFSSSFVQHFAIDLLVFSSWCCKYYTFSPTPQVFNIIHSFTSFYEYPKKFTLIPKRWAYKVPKEHIDYTPTTQHQLYMQSSQPQKFIHQISNGT